MKHALTGPFILLAVIFFALFAIPFSTGAFGVSPPFINAEKLVKGSRFETTVYLVQGQPVEDLEVKAVFDVPEKVRSWFSVDKGEQFIIPAGVQQFPIKVTIKVPDDVELGIYQGALRINTVPKRKEGEQIAISVGARIELNLTVGEGAFFDYVIRKLDILDIEEGDSPAFVVPFETLGNVPAAPDRATIDVLDKFGNVRLGYAQVEEFEEIPPFETKTFVVEFPVNIALGIGEYWAEARIYRGDQVVRDIKTVFNVIERKIPYALYGGIAALALVFLAGSVFLRKKILRKK